MGIIIHAFMGHSYCRGTMRGMQEYAYNTRLMGTDVSVSLVMSRRSSAQKIARATFAAITEYERRFSRFMPHSELSQLNAKGTAEVSEVFMDVFERSYELFKETRGAYNPLVQVARFGYDRDFVELTASTRAVSAGPYNIDLESTEVDRTTRRITLKEGQQLDVGGFLKGYLAEKLARAIERAHPECQGIIVNIGGDLHTRGVDTHGMLFEFLVYNPVTDTEEPIVVYNQSLATSGTYARTWQTEHGAVHHILGSDGQPNPRTPYVSASIVHEHGDTAEAYAKMFLLRGKEAALKVAVPGEYSYYLVTPEGRTISNIV